jgi:hypothetical protein
MGAGRLINVPNGRSTSLLTLIEELNRLLGTNVKPRHEAARVGALGGPGEIYASLATVLLVDGIVHSEPERVTLKGISEPIDVVTIDWR